MNAKQWNQMVGQMAGKLLEQWVGEARAKEAAGRLMAALAASAQAAKKPHDFYSCSPASVAQVVAISALTGIMPGTGATALAYAIPRKVKGSMTLGYQLSHRGIAALARRGGSSVIAIPVGQGDTLKFEWGEVAGLDPDPDNPPTTWDDLRGVVVVVKDAKTGTVLHRGWVARKVIETRREESDSFKFAVRRNEDWAFKASTWHKWPVEMAMKTALHYAIARAWVVVDDTEAVRALSADAVSDTSVIDIPATDVELRSETNAPALPDFGERDDLAGLADLDREAAYAALQHAEDQDPGAMDRAYSDLELGSQVEDLSDDDLRRLAERLGVAL